MYFKINRPITDKFPNMGMINIFGDFFLEEGDEGFEKYKSEHYINIPILPDCGYPRQAELQSQYEPPIEEVLLYEQWLSELPKEYKYNSFCTHAIQFEPDVTEEEILWCFEWALALTHQNYLIDDLCCVNTGKLVNQNIGYSAHKAWHELIKQTPENDLSEEMLLAKQKIIDANIKIENLKEVDFTTVETIAVYNVRN